MMIPLIKRLIIFGLFIFPFILFKSFTFPLVFSHVMFMFVLIELIALLFLLHSLDRGHITFKKGWINILLLLYLLIMFITAITGEEFSYSFWGNFSRMTGLITWIHYSILFFIASVVLKDREDWVNVFRALSLSGFFLVLFSFLGRDGLNIEAFSFLKQGGSFLGNTSYSGAYEVLIFFISFIGLSLEKNRKWIAVYIVSLLSIFLNPDLFNFEILNGGVSIFDAFKNPALFFGLARTSSVVLWLGLFIFLILFSVNKVKNKKVVIVTSVSLLVLISCAYVYGFYSLTNEGSKARQIYIEQSGPVRLMVWDMAVEGIKDRPLLGYGNGNFKYVYQEYLDSRIINLEDPPWFDRVHNFTLEEIINHGLFGISIVIAMFIILCRESIRLFKRDNGIYFLFAPFIFMFHFLQMQTFFQVDSTLLLSFVLLAFIVSKTADSDLDIPRKLNKDWLRFIILIFFIISIVFFVIKPSKENRLISRVNNELVRSTRMEAQKGLFNLNIDPAETLRQLNEKFSNATAKQVEQIIVSGFSDNVKQEYQTYLNLYESYLPRYENYYRYLIEYSNLINASFIFNIDEFKKGEELARKALLISDKYPYPYIVLATNLYYQDRNEEALEYAQKGYEVNKSIYDSLEFYDMLKANIDLNSTNKAFIYLPKI